MNYIQTIDYLYAHVPMFQQQGSTAYKEGLENTLFLDDYFQHPHRNYSTIHVAGTNGKGSVSHLLASVLQSAGYKVGLYTSPHLKDFRERIRINGKSISEQTVIDFVAENKLMIENHSFSFFELTTALAFLYFAKQNVDVAVIETGLGGRIDCTNIITPKLSIITNISFDHCKILGNTLEAIATEKAGIIKHGVPVVIGEYSSNAVFEVFKRKAVDENAPICFVQKTESFDIPCALHGFYQKKNKQTALAAITVLQQQGFDISDKAVQQGFMQVVKQTGLQGRWQKLSKNPTIVCDTGHNEAGIKYVVQQLLAQKYKTLRIVFGMVNDKDIRSVLALLPTDAVYYFTKAAIPRALNERELQQQASLFGLHGTCFDSVQKALTQAKADADTDDFIFVGGSNFVVAEII